MQTYANKCYLKETLVTSCDYGEFYAITSLVGLHIVTEKPVMFMPVHLKTVLLLWFHLTSITCTLNVFV